MLAIRKVLIPTDFSECAESALPYAIHLASECKAELHTLHAVVVYGGASLLGEEKALEALEKIEMTPARRVFSAVHQGVSAADVILDYATNNDIDLIVLGSHGHRGVRRFLLGSVAEEVIRLASCPVLSVLHQENVDPSSGVEFSTIVVPTDFSRYSDVALRYAGEIAKRRGAKIHLIHVIEELLYPDFYLPVSGASIHTPEMRQEARERLSECIEAKLPKALAADAQLHVAIGRTSEEIANYAAEVRADLLVIASHGLRGLERILLGSVAEQVIRAAPCSVLTVKAFGKTLLPTP